MADEENNDTLDEGVDPAPAGEGQDSIDETLKAAFEGEDKGAGGEASAADDWAAALEESGDAAPVGADDWAAALEESGDAAREEEPEPVVQSAQAGAPSAEFNELTNHPGEPIASIDMIVDIPVTISVELGRSRMLIKDLLQLGQGSVVELEKLAGESMEILVNGKLIARGEVVVVNDKFGVRITDIISPTERVKQLS